MLPNERKEVIHNILVGMATVAISLLTYIIYLPLVTALKILVVRALPAEFAFVLPAIPWFSLAALFSIAMGIISLLSGKNPKWVFFTGFLILVQVFYRLLRP